MQCCAKQLLVDHGYKLVSRQEFEQATDLPQGLLERAKNITGAFVVYDPNDDAEGFMLIADSEIGLACNAAVHLELF